MDPEQFAEALREMLARGFELPFTAAAIGANGSAYLFRFEPDDNGLRPDTLAEHIEGGVFALPVNMMIVDSRGEAARVVFAKTGVTYN